MPLADFSTPDRTSSADYSSHFEYSGRLSATSPGSIHRSSLNWRDYSSVARQASSQRSIEDKQELRIPDDKTYSAVSFKQQESTEMTSG